MSSGHGIVPFTLNDNSPDTLFNICIRSIAKSLNNITTMDSTSRRRLRAGIILPTEICERLLEACQEEGHIDDSTVNMFRDRDRSRLSIIKLNTSHITDEGLKILMDHKPTKLELIKCDNLSESSFDIIKNNSENLVSLKLGPDSTIFSQENNRFSMPLLALEAPNLRSLSLHCAPLRRGLILPSAMPSMMTHFDLSDCTINSSWTFSKFTNLKYLVLHNVLDNKETFGWISCLPALRFLDISQADERHGEYEAPNEILTRIVTKLPELEALDISCTNLAGTGVAEVPPTVPGLSNMESNNVRCDIPGLMSRVDRPLQFLGLYGAHHGACRFHDIPAKVITGDANEEQLLNAATAYMQRPNLLTRILNDLYFLFRSENIVQIAKSLCFVLDAMENHITEKYVQISGSATLFYIVKGKEKDRFGIKLKRRIIKTLVIGMETHVDDYIMMRNGCLTLCQFKVPNDLLFEYERIVQILLDCIADVTQESFVQRIAIYLLNSLACQVDGKQKRFLGSHGAIEKMLNVISDRLERNVCDDVLEVAWSTMWNVTDETPQNCKTFLLERGMEYFLACLKNFAHRGELMRNMMGLLGNVAEVGDLRPILMTKEFITVFYELLDSSSDGIEVSYNAAGVLAHIASDGPEAWTVEEPSREMVLNRMTAAIGRWNLRVERNINYRSFVPILALFKAHHTQECQYWAVWALANLTIVYPEKYCKLVLEEGGLELLTELYKRRTTYGWIKHLAHIVIVNCAVISRRQGRRSPINVIPDY